MPTQWPRAQQPRRSRSRVAGSRGGRASLGNVTNGASTSRRELLRQVFPVDDPGMLHQPPGVDVSSQAPLAVPREPEDGPGEVRLDAVAEPQIVVIAGR